MSGKMENPNLSIRATLIFVVLILAFVCYHFLQALCVSKCHLSSSTVLVLSKIIEAHIFSIQSIIMFWASTLLVFVDNVYNIINTSHWWPRAVSLTMTLTFFIENITIRCFVTLLFGNKVDSPSRAALNFGLGSGFQVRPNIETV